MNGSFRSDPYLFLCSASRGSGLGHLYRSIALRDAICDRGRCRALVWIVDPEWRTLTSLPSCVDRAVANIDEALALLGSEEPAAIVLDVHEKYEPEFIHRVAKRKVPYIVIDDVGAVPPQTFAAVIVCGQAHADAIDYESTGCKQVLRGPRYIILRSDYFPIDRDKKKDSRTLLLTFGGGETHRIERVVLDALYENLDALSGWTVRLVVGAAYPYDLEPLQRAYAGLEIQQNVKRMVDVMLNSGAAFSAAGDTLYELLATGVPTASIVIAENQVATHAALAKADAVIPLGRHPFPGVSSSAIRDAWRLLRNEEVRGRIRANGFALVDGQGARRVAEAILGMVGCR